MQKRLRGVVFACFLIFHPLAWGGSEEDAAPLTPDTFGQCQFSVVGVEHAKVQEKAGKSAEYAYCSVRLSLPSNTTVEFPKVFVMGLGLHEREKLEGGGNSNNGFVLDNAGHWHFEGTNFLLSSKMLKTSFTEDHSSDETLLVGQQLIKGNIAQGGPITVPGIRILRITPEFVVSVELNFQPLHYEKQNKGYKQLREAVSRELVEIVKSVKTTPGVPGPTVRLSTR